MEFFTKKMWLGLQDDSRGKYWNKIWSRKIKLYNKHLNKLKSKLSKKSFLLFSKGHLHGDYLMQIDVINKGKINKFNLTNEIREAAFKKALKNSIEIHIKTICPSGYFYILRYKGVKRYLLDYPSVSPLYFDEGNFHDSWGYDEISYLKDGYFRHEILFHSGATVFIEFKDFNYKTTKIA